MLGTWSKSGRGIESGGAGLFSTVDDYARFAQMLCNSGTLNGERILGRTTVELMTANHLTALPESAHVFNRAKGFSLVVEITLHAGRGAVPTTTYSQIDPKEQLMALAFAQHFPLKRIQPIRHMGRRERPGLKVT